MEPYKEQKRELRQSISRMVGSTRKIVALQSKHIALKDEVDISALIDVYESLKQMNVTSPQNKQQV